MDLVGDGEVSLYERNNPPAWDDEEGYAEYCAWRDDIRTQNLAKLLLECRDALPAIPLPVAVVRRIDLTLASRVDEALRPWEVTK